MSLVASAVPEPCAAAVKVLWVLGTEFLIEHFHAAAVDLHSPTFISATTAVSEMA
jgi:hypothetical protein